MSCVDNALTALVFQNMCAALCEDKAHENGADDQYMKLEYFLRIQTQRHVSRDQSNSLCSPRDVKRVTSRYKEVGFRPTELINIVEPFQIFAVRTIKV